MAKMTYGNVSEISDNNKKKYANKYLECPLKIEKFKSFSKKDYMKEKGSFAFTVLTIMEGEVENSSGKCSGTVLEY